jgi:hypothetical protein
MSSLPKMLGAMRRWISASTSGRLANSWNAWISSLLNWSPLWLSPDCSRMPTTRR